MGADSRAKQLQRSIVISSAVGILLVGVIVAVASIVPLYEYLRKEEARNLVLALNTKTAAVEEYLTRAKDVAGQIASRTVPRERLQAYNEGQLDLTELARVSSIDLSDAIAYSHEVWGITRLDAHGTPVLELGLEIPSEAWQGRLDNMREETFLDPITLGRRPYLVVAAPIRDRKGTRFGTDLILFRLYHLHRIVSDATGLGQTGDTVLGVVHADRVDLVFPFRDDSGTVARTVAKASPLGQAMEKAALKQSGLLVSENGRDGRQVMAYGPIRGGQWGIVVRMNEDELYAPVNRQIIATAQLILGLILIGTFAVVLSVRPLAGKLIIHAGELERQVLESTESLQRELAERRRVEQWLRDSERRYRVLLEEVPDVIFLMDADGRLTYTNIQVEKLFECPVQEVLEQPLKDYVAPEYKPKIDGLLSMSLDMIWDEEVGLVDARGGEKWARIRCKAFRQDETGPVRFEGVIRDITRRKKLEQEVNNSREELLEKIRIIDDLYEHIVQSGKAKAIADHTAEVAHELRQPLAIIGGFARRMARQMDAGEPLLAFDQRQYCRIMVSEVQRLERILVNLIEFTRHESLRLEKCDPNRIIEGVLNAYQGRMKDKGITLETVLGTEVGEILLDPDRFEQVVRNLVSNAVEASPPGAAIYVESGASIPSGKASETGGLEWETFFELKIRNFGKVIPPEDLHKIFSPFYTTKDYGTGIGLTLAKRIIEDHEGSVSVKSDEEGTLFTVWLPMPRPDQA
ncbi:MAG: PAS domain S-box protein [Desulfomonile tiedjei]|nr:PAS domain S-box protein [Desulfomonile tiedjei]